jgi:hypothetical protein
VWIAKYVFPILGVWFVQAWLFRKFRPASTVGQQQTRDLILGGVAILIVLVGLVALGIDYLRMNKVWH